jgi:hypothetical protein
MSNVQAIDNKPKLSKESM